MLKNLLSLAAIFLLISCAGKNTSSDDEAQVEDQTQIVESQDETPTPYQTLDNEAQAIELNVVEEQKIEEVEVQDRIFFDYDSFGLNDESRKILDTQVAWLKSDLNIKVTVEGHADERGTREYNIALGEKRAKSVRDYLIANGVEASRIKTISYGKERPAFFGANEEIFSKNRRAVTVIN
jgi:peptidoglycan-associated lipoprotein